MMSFRAIAKLGLGMICAAALVPGCGWRRAGFERYIPDAARAQRALERALAAWKSGEPVGPLALADPAVAIEVADGNRRPGQRLVDYQVVGEVSADGPRCFVVRLTLDQPAQEVETRYYVAGIDPLWVFRQEDYALLMYWENCNEVPGDSPADAPSASRQPRAESRNGVTR